MTELTDGTLTQSRSYNDFGEVTEVSDNTFTYTLTQRDKSGAITQKQESINGTSSTYDYTYDERGRLIEVSKDGAVVERYTYDANGNRASAEVYGHTFTGSYTLDDQLEVYGQNTYRYDDDGYLIEKITPDGTTSYGYNTMGALTDVTLPDGMRIHYITDPLNRRIAKEVNGTITEKYLWEDLTTLLAVYDKDDNLVWRFEYADGRMPVSMTDKDGNRYYLHYDQVGSLRAVSDINGKVVKEIVYDTFGNILSDSAPSFRIPFGFAGGLYDPDTKLTHFGYREYDAFTGKWTAKDPILFEGGDSNLYGYVLGDPVNLVDPWGLASSGITTVVPGTKIKVRIDNPHVPGQQKHAHIYPKKGKSCVINKDGTGSHGTKPKIKNKKLIDFLKKKGFDLKALQWMLPLTEHQIDLYQKGLIGPNGEDLSYL